MTQIQGGSKLALGLCAAIALPALFLLDSSVAYINGWLSGSRLDALLVSAAVLGVVVPCLAMIISPVRRWVRGAAGKLVLCSVAILFGVLSGEAVLRAFFSDAIEYHTRGPNLTLVLKPNPTIVPAWEHDIQYTTNSRGIRGPEFPPRDDAYRILCVGGSTTEGTCLGDDDTWTHVLMDRLNADQTMHPVWTGGIGMAGYTTENHLKFIRKSKLVDEVDCLVCLVGINDFQWALSAPPLEWLRGAEPLWARSSLIGKVRVLGRRAVPHAPVMIEDTLGDQRLRRQKMDVDDTLPSLSQGLIDYQQRIRSMAENAKRRNVRLVFATQPVMWDKNLSAQARSLLWLGLLDNGKCLSVDKMRIGMEQYNQALASVCEEIGVPYVDLSPLHGNEEYYIDDCHFTVKGADQVARLIAEWFVEHRAGDRWAGSP